MTPAASIEQEQPAMHSMSKRLLIGFGAGALSHVFFQGALGTILYAADLLPELVWSLKPVPPFAVPTTVNNMFWDGLWGLLYAFLEPRLTPKLGRLGGGLMLGLASLFVFWFLVLPLKGGGIGSLDGADIAIDLAFDLVFGLGIALLFWAGLNLTYRPVVPRVGKGARS
jgi:hypothetical protein